MDCTLCGKSIENYRPELHCLYIDDGHKADICPECMDKIMKWQGEKYAVLFPTNAMKKRFGEKKQKGI